MLLQISNLTSKEGYLLDEVRYLAGVVFDARYLSRILSDYGCIGFYVRGVFFDGE